ncbi:MAG: DUF6152 family protein [Rhodospirillaceae bacterium]|nr:DUF6152 family protein [Rhodospirillaceae bacterium]
MLRPTNHLLLVGALGLAVQAGFAHHSVSGNFDQDARHDITGTLTAFHLRNPHSHLELDVVEEDGTVSRWLVEWGTRNDLIRRGVDLDRIKVGDELTVTLVPSRRLEHVGYARALTLPDGSVIRDCGFRAFREALLEGRELECEEPDR